MKNYILILAVSVIITACNNKNNVSSIPGTYVNAAQSEYSIVSDTLIVEPASGNTFFIHRKTSYQLIKNGKPGRLQHENEEWQAVYDETTKVLTETCRGKLITPFPEAGKLMVGKREYIKLTNKKFTK